MASYYLVDKTGETRYVWGPYETFPAAKKAAGVLSFVATGERLAGVKKMTRGELNRCLTVGSVVVAEEGVDKWSLA